ncbi:hypothetical protein X975_06028, partial [Stegodyphus mimosarum]
MLCSTFLFFVVPMTLISVLYFRISITLHRARNMHRAETVSQNRTDGQRARIQSRRIVIRMLSAFELLNVSYFTPPIKWSVLTSSLLYGSGSDDVVVVT